MSFSRLCCIFLRQLHVFYCICCSRFSWESLGRRWRLTQWRVKHFSLKRKPSLTPQMTLPCVPFRTSVPQVDFVTYGRPLHSLFVGSRNNLTWPFCPSKWVSHITSPLVWFVLDVLMVNLEFWIFRKLDFVHNSITPSVAEFYFFISFCGHRPIIIPDGVPKRWKWV